MNEELEIVVYDDSSGDTQVWAGPASSWAEHAEAYGVTRDDVIERLTVIGKIEAPKRALDWP